MRKNSPRSAFAAGGNAQREPIVILATVHSNDGYMLTLNLSLRAQRGNLVEVEHTLANHHCYRDEIATSLRSSQ